MEMSEIIEINGMSGRITIEVDLISELEEMTNYAPDSYLDDWRSMDTERLRRIVEYLDRQVEKLGHEKN